MAEVRVSIRIELIEDDQGDKVPKSPGWQTTDIYKAIQVGPEPLCYRHFVNYSLGKTVDNLVHVIDRDPVLK